jgi:biopolymer transport protein ExbD
VSISVQEARSIIRKAVKRVPEGENITHLNIMPMMDMMTILLVAFIFQVATGAEAITASSVELPLSTSQEAMPEAATVVIITGEAIVVEDQEVVAVRNGDVDAAQKKGGRAGFEIIKLTQFLGALRQSNDAELRSHGKEPARIPELMIIGDRTTPYRLLLSVMFSAKQKESGYKRFRLITLQSSPTGPGL